MHLVFINQYYPPDVAPTGVMLEDLAAAMVRKGHRVTVLCATGGYAGRGVTSDQLAVISEEGEGDGAQALGSQNSKFKIQNPSILRIGATSFGRQSFVGKLADYASYYLGVTWKLMTMHPRPERIVAMTTPPYLAVLARAVSKFRRADHAHWVMDLYPDVMVAHGMVANRGWSHRILAGFARWGFGGRRCAAVVTLGPDMAERVGRYVGTRNPGETGTPRHPNTGTPVSWVPLWGTGGRDVLTHASADIATGGPGARDDVGRMLESAPTFEAEAAAALRKERGWQATDLVVMYSGNMGLGHRFGEILAAARELAGLSARDQEGRTHLANAGHGKRSAGGRVRFAFFGGGRRRDEVLEFLNGHPGCGVELHDYAPAEILTTHLRSADVHLVSLNAEWTGTMVPSKLQGIFAAGRPVVFIGSGDSSIAQWVLESGGGWVVRPGHVAGLLAALDEASNPNVRAARGQAALDYAAVHFTKKLNVERMVEIYESIIM